MMSVAGILSSSLFNLVSPTSQSGTNSSQTNASQFQQEFQQLGQDLQSGSLSKAQSDLASLQAGTQASSTTSAQSSNPLNQQFNQLSLDLQSGNISAAQQDYATIQQDAKTNGEQAHHHHHHHMGESGSTATTDSGTDSTSQLLQQMGQALQSGNLSAAQQAYSSVMQNFQQFTM
jgi:outer membrane protein assembly factor BamD (BamD/ComL family)